MNPSRTIIGIQGGKCSFNEQACTLYCQDHDIENFDLLYLYTSDKVLEYLAAGKGDFGLFAITNNLSGIVLESLEACAKYNFQVIDVFDMPVQYALLGKRGGRLKDITTIMSHPTVLDGCRQTLAKRFADKEISEGRGILIDQAAAAATLAESGSPSTLAVIAPAACAQTHGLEVLADDMQDAPCFTTFVWCKKR